MTCDSKGAIGKIQKISQPAIVKGSDAFIIAQIVQAADKSKPISFSDFQGATGYFANADGTSLEVIGALESQDLGTVRFDLTAQQTSGLLSGEERSFEFGYTDESGVKFIQFDSNIQIRERIF